MSSLREASRNAALPLVFAVAFAAAFHLWLGATYIGLADEGFVWYGVLRVRAGEIPMRDFQAYDPGRYYWCALWSFVFGTGIVGVRAAGAVFEALGLFCGLLVARRITKSTAGLVACTVILGLWMFPRHKVFEPALTLIVVWAGVRVLEDPGPRKLFQAGVLTGLAAWFGRNHALYLVLGFTTLALYLWWKRALRSPRRGFGALALGIAVGSLPLTGMLLCVPGFAAGFAGSILHVMEVGSNLPEPYPWPWRVDLAGWQGFLLFGKVALSVAFLLPVVAYPVGLFVALRTPREALAARAVPIAAALLGVFYVHHVAVRSDAYHLAQSIPPVLLLCLSLPAALSARALPWVLATSVLTAVTLLAAPFGNPILTHVLPGEEREFVDHEVAGETLHLPTGQARLLDNLVAACERVGDEPMFIGPRRPSFYAVLGKRSPVWWIYILWSLSEAEQQEAIRRLEEGGVNWVLIVDDFGDGREEDRFVHTNPLLWRYIAESFVAVADSRLPPAHFLFQRKDG